jgi:hypothetical protein
MKLKVFVLIIAALVMISCNALENDSTSGSMLEIVSLTGNDLDGTPGSTTVFSDVVTNGSIFNDNGVASLAARPLDPTLATTSAYMDVLVDQIDIVFKRTDGRNVEGVDVPYSFTHPVSFLVPIRSSANIPFVLIRHVAKMESPLVDLRDPLNPEQVIQIIAWITIHSKDTAGHRLADVTGYITVWCADFADPA